jgi:hypothetical protein
MKSVEFIKDKINFLVAKYPDTKYRYELDLSDDTHYIEVKSNGINTSDNKLLNDEAEIMDEFMNLFPFEGVTFFDKSDFIEIKKPIYELEGKEFKKTDQLREFLQGIVRGFTQGNINNNTLSFNDCNDNMFYEKVEMATKNKEEHSLAIAA